MARIGWRPEHPHWGKVRLMAALALWAVITVGWTLLG
jgi:hypothetical protein